MLAIRVIGIRNYLGLYLNCDEKNGRDI